MPKAETVFEIDDENEAALQAAIANDRDGREASDEQLAAMRPAAEVLSPSLLASLRRGRGRPKSDRKKIPVRLRLDPFVVEVFRASGAGWQTRMNEALGEAARSLEGHAKSSKAKQAFGLRRYEGPWTSPEAMAFVRGLQERVFEFWAPPGIASKAKQPRGGSTRTPRI